MSGQELVTRPEALIPGTGEVIDVRAAETSVLAEALDRLSEVKQMEASARRVIADEVLRRQDADASWTTHVEGFTLVGQSPAREEYDAEALAAVLRGLVELSMISAEAAGAAIESVLTWKPKKAGINALLKLGGEIAEAVRSCAITVDKPRQVRVKRSDGSAS